MEQASDGNYITAVDCSDFPSLMCQLNLDNYWITCVRTSLEEELGATEELYDQNQESFNEALETIAIILGEEDTFHVTDFDGKDGKEDGLMEGPRRIELLLRKNENPTDEARIIVTGLVPSSPKQSFITIVGRRWKSYGTMLSRTMEHFPNTNYWISEMVLFTGGATGAASTFSYGRSSKELSWNQLERSYYAFKTSELVEVRSWNPSSGQQSIAHAGFVKDSCLEFYGAGEHYTQRVPSVYQVRTGCFRVAGDEIGAELFRKQEALRKNGPTSLEKLINREESVRGKVTEKNQKKAQADGNLPPTLVAAPSRTSARAGASKSNTSKLATTGTPSIDARSCDCSSLLCEDCLWSQACEQFGSSSALAKAVIH